jgi:hypothetical protein
VSWRLCDAEARFAPAPFAGSTPGTNGFYTYCIFAPLNNIQSEFGTIPATIYGT